MKAQMKDITVTAGFSVACSGVFFTQYRTSRPQFTVNGLYVFIEAFVFAVCELQFSPPRIALLRS